jgi:hypothetical protein
LRSLILIIIALILVSSAYGAQNAKITVDKEGSYYYWFTYSDIKGKAVTTTPVSFTDKKATIELPLVKDAVPKCTLFVLNETSGNEVVLPVNAKPGQPVKFDLNAAGFDKVRRVEVLVTSSGKPAAAAIVKLDLGDKKEHLQVLDPSAQGIVQFTDVPSGTTKVIVEYGDGKTASQDVDVPLDREDRIPRVEIPIVGQIDTVNAPEAAAKADGKSGEAAKEPVNNTVNLPTAVVGLLFLGLIVYGATKLMSKRGAGFRQVLKGVGVNLPGESEPEPMPLQSTPAAPIDPTVCPFCGGKKDPVSGACACTVGPGGAVSTPSAGSGPRLIATQGAYAGSIYQLDGVMIAGREESNPIAFPQDTTVSRKHARIVLAGGTVTIVDEGSSNGTFVNGVKISEQVLNPGDEVQIGNTRLRYES